MLKQIRNDYELMRLDDAGRLEAACLAVWYVISEAVERLLPWRKEQ